MKCIKIHFTKHYTEVNGTPLTVVQGQSKIGAGDDNVLDTLLTKNTNIYSKICQHRNNYYHKNFIRITGDFPIKQLSDCDQIPHDFEDHFSQNDLNALDKNIIWIKAELPESFSSDFWKMYTVP